MSTRTMIQRMIGSTLLICGVIVLLLEHMWMPYF
jgi:hypothetical protein